MHSEILSDTSMRSSTAPALFKINNNGYSIFHFIERSIPEGIKYLLRWE